MNISELSVKRPVFMTSVLVGILVVGVFSFKKTPVDLFPDINFPIVTVNTIYPGAGPSEIETLVSKPLEEELGTIAGIKNIRSVSRESVSTVIAEFTLETDIKYAEQQIRDRTSSARVRLPKTIEEPVIRRVDPSAQPIIAVAIKSSKSGPALFDLANEKIRPLLEQVDQVGRVDVVGGKKREIQVQLDREILSKREISVSKVVQALSMLGNNIPAGKVDQTTGEMVYRSLGEFNHLKQIEEAVVNFYGNDVVTRVKDLGVVSDTTQDEKVRAFLNGEETAFLYIYKQSGSNTLKVSKDIKKRLERIVSELRGADDPKLDLTIVRDMSKYVAANVEDVSESIFLGIILTIIVVFMFLGSFKSTVITGLAIPFSLVGSMTLLYLAGISINVMSLLAFSLAVGLLIDDAIVVRENIFRHLEMGKSPMQAALDGTKEVQMAVVAVTLAILAVFGPLAFLSGVVGQFFKSFGLGVCFVMMLSLFDALSNAPMLSAYFGGGDHSLHNQELSFKHPIKSLLILFDRFQTSLENGYSKLVHGILRYPWLAIVLITILVFGLASTAKYIPKTFIPPQDSGEFRVKLELPPGTNLDEMEKGAKKADEIIRKNENVTLTTTTVGNSNNQSYTSEIYVRLISFKNRKFSTSQVKQQLRDSLKELSYLDPKVMDVDFIGAGQRPFVVNIKGQDLDEIRKVGAELFLKLKNSNGLSDPEFSDRPGLPEFQIKIDDIKAHEYGVTPALVGLELRAQVEGVNASKFRENGLEYDVRVRLQNGQRNLEKNYYNTKVSNLNGRLVKVSEFTKTKKEVGYSNISRENRTRYVSIEADVAPNGPGMGGVMQQIDHIFSSGEIKLPPGVTYRFVGQAENFKELGESIVIAGLLGIIFIYLVLASLYESLVTPIAIMTVIPFAVVGGFAGLYLMNSTLDLFSMIGSVMLMGLATKNSIILVDYINQKMADGLEVKEAIAVACKTRLRPILMTSVALVAGMMPVAIGLNEASSQRVSLGIAVVSGVVVSTILTLVMIPAVFNYIEQSRRWLIKNIGSKMISS